MRSYAANDDSRHRGKARDEVSRYRCGRGYPRRQFIQGPFCQRAQDLEANAVIGIDIDYEIMGKENGMMMVSASGTAVTVE